MKFFLVDYENVNSSGLEGINCLDEDDKVVIFYGPNSNTVSFSVVEFIRKSDINIDLFELRHPAPNAVDFQLSTYLGYLIAKEKDAEFYIISKDKGYGSSIDFCNDFLINYPQKIERFTNIASAINSEPYFVEISILKDNLTRTYNDKTAFSLGDLESIQDNSTPIKKQKVMSLINSLGDEITSSDKKQVYDTVLNYLKTTSNKEEFYKKLIKKYNKEDGLKYYNIFKGEYKKLKAL